MAMSEWYRYELRVRYEETDQMGVVYHANYLNWFEIGRTELIREMGITYRELESRGLLLPVVEAEMKFRQPAKYDDIVTIETRIADYSPATMTFESAIMRSNGEAEELLVSGRTRHVWLNGAWKPVRVLKEAPELNRLLREHCR